ncbi:YdcF family protein [Angustibacter peucedani]
MLRAVRTVVVAAVCVALVVFVLTAAAVVQHGRTDEARTADAILVLGAAQFDGTPQQYLVARLEHARDLYESGAAPRILTLGGKRPGDRFTEGEAGRTWLVDHGVPSSAVQAVGEGNDTLGSIRSAAQVLRDDHRSTAIVVTDPWHELRSTTMLEDQGITAYGSPTRTGPSVAGLGVKVRYVTRETAAFLAYSVRKTLS